MDFMFCEKNQTTMEKTRKVMETLPEWFGITEFLEDYVKCSAEYDTLGCYDKGELAGFVTIKKNYAHAAEIYCMAVRRDLRGQGMGRQLMSRAETFMRDEGIKYVQVKTLSEVCKDDGYANTRSFYTSMGFEPLETVQEIWGEKRPCLIMIKAI